MSVVANVAINVDSTGAVGKLRQVQSQAQQTERAFSALTNAAAAFGAGFALSRIVADVKELDTNLRRLGTVGVDVAKINPALSALSKELDGVASKAELAAASYQAASAGFSDTAGNISILRAATKAATGGLADTQAVTEVLVKTLNSYGMAGDQATKVTDSISKAVELGNQEWSDYTSQLGRVASIAALAGVSLDEVNAFIASATKNGATAEIAFTGLGATLNTLLQPTKESQEAAAKLGIAWNYGGLQAKGFTGLMRELAVAMERDKETTARLLGSQEAMRGAFAANAKSGKDFQMILGELSNAAGKTDADFNTMKTSLENQLKALDTAFKTLSESLGVAFGPAVVSTIGDVAGAVNAIAGAISAVPQPVMNATAEMVKLVAQILLLQKAIQVIIGLRTAFVGSMVAMAATTTAAGTAATTSSSAFALYTANTRTLQAAAATATPVLNGMLLTLRNLAAIGAIAIVVNVAVTGMAAVYQAQAEIDRLRGVRSRGGAAAAFGGSATAEQKKAQQATLAAIKKERQSAGFRGQQAAAAAGIGTTFARQRADQLAERERSARAVLALPLRGGAARPAVAANAMGTPIGATVGGGGGGRSGGGGGGGAEDAKRAAEAAARAAAELADLQRQVTLKEKLFGIDKQIAIEKQRGSAVTASALEMDKALEERQSRIAEITRSSADAKTKEAQIKSATLDADEKIFAVQQAINQQQSERLANFNSGLQALTDQTAVEAQLTEEGRRQTILQQEINKLKKDGVITTTEQEEAYRNATNALEATKQKTQQVITLQQQLNDTLNQVGSTVGDVFQQLIFSTDSWSNSLRNALNSLANLLFQSALSGLAGTDGKGFFSFLTGTLGKRANGGSVNAGAPYMVGERGPELFVPGRSGTIVSNENLTGGGGGVNVIVNVDAKGSSVQGDDQNAMQLGRVISAAVKSEIITQQRPGGLLAGKR